MDDVVKIALMLVVIVTFLFIVPVVFERAQDYYQRQTCAQSINTALTSREVQGLVSAKIRCPTEERTFGTDAEVKASVASALKYCWSRWRAGKADFFAEMGVLCDVCVRFAAGDPRDVSGIRSYLSGMNGPEGMTLADYLAKSTNTIPDSINTGQSYAVIFRYVGFTDPAYADIHVVPFTKESTDALQCQKFPVSQEGPQ